MSRAAAVVRGAGLGALAIALASCKASAPSRGSAPQSPTGPRGEGEDGPSAKQRARLDGDDVDALEAELVAAADELHAIEAQPPQSPPEPATGRDGVRSGNRQDSSHAGDRCRRIATLADRICALSERMCELADEHPTQGRYADACARAEQTCERAETARDECEP